MIHETNVLCTYVHTICSIPVIPSTKIHRSDASVGGMALGGIALRAPTALPGRETISAKAFRLPATLAIDQSLPQNDTKNSSVKPENQDLDVVLGISLEWRCSYDTPACLVLFW